MTQYARPASDVANADFWFISGAGGVVNIWQGINDDAAESTASSSPSTPDDATYLRSQNLTTTSVYTASLGTVTDPVSAADHILHYRYSKSGGDRTLNLTVSLLQGGSTIASWTHNNISSTVTADQTLTSTQANSITDYSDLEVSFSASVTGGSTATRFTAYWVEFECPDVAGGGGGGTPGVITVVANASAALSSASPSVTFSGYTPQANDLVLLFPSSATTALPTAPAGWVNPLGGSTDIESTAPHELCCVYHFVTSTEQTNGTTTYTATNLYNATEAGNVIGCVVRGVDTTNPVDGTGTQTVASTTPHATATVLSGNVPNTGSSAFSCVTKRTTGSYTNPTGWTQIATSNTNQAKWVGVRDTLTTAATIVSATIITPNLSDSYCSITVIFKPAPVPVNTAQFFAMF